MQKKTRFIKWMQLRMVLVQIKLQKSNYQGYTIQYLGQTTQQMRVF